MNSKSLDIKSLTSALKSQTKSHKKDKEDFGTKIGNKYPDRSSMRQGRIKTENQIIDSKEHSDLTRDLREILEKVNERTYNQIDRFIYVDADIHEVFLKLKSYTKLKISHLASYLLEEFINEHKKAIIDITSKKQNKFLDE